jgi:hypothetical protein
MFGTHLSLLADARHVGRACAAWPQLQHPHLLKPARNPNHWKPLFGRLTLLSDVVGRFGVHQGSSGELCT